MARVILSNMKYPLSKRRLTVSRQCVRHKRCLTDLLATSWFNNKLWHRVLTDQNTCQLVYGLSPADLWPPRKGYSSPFYLHFRQHPPYLLTIVRTGDCRSRLSDNVVTFGCLRSRHLSRTCSKLCNKYRST